MHAFYNVSNKGLFANSKYSVTYMQIIFSMSDSIILLDAYPTNISIEVIMND